MSQSTEEMLSELIELGMVLKIDPLIGGVFDIAKGISEQCDKEMELELRVHETQFMEQKLQAELEKMIALRTKLQQSTWNQEMKQDTIDEKISEWTRGIKLIQAKTEEYQSRTTAAKVSSILPNGLVLPPIRILLCNLHCEIVGCVC